MTMPTCDNYSVVTTKYRCVEKANKGESGRSSGFAQRPYMLPTYKYNRSCKSRQEISHSIIPGHVTEP